MAYKASRRRFLKTTAAAGMGYWVAGGVRAQQSNSPNEKIAFASVGIGGKGSSDSNDARHRGDMVAICDVDTGRLEGAKGKSAGARTYTDFRKMLDEMGNRIDAVLITTPDHTHAPPAVMAMNLGKHVYCEKPLAHDIYKVRMMSETAKKNPKVVTQMGNQMHSQDNYRRVVELIRAGAIGTIEEVNL